MDNLWNTKCMSCTINVACIYATPELGFDSCCLHSGAEHPLMSSCDATGYYGKPWENFIRLVGSKDWAWNFWNVSPICYPWNYLTWYCISDSQVCKIIKLTKGIENSLLKIKFYDKKISFILLWPVTGDIDSVKILVITRARISMHYQT